jgi:hypothetical protein
LTIVYPINGKNERMGSLFKTPKHLLLHKGVPLILKSVDTMLNRFKNSKVLIITNVEYYNTLNEIFEKNKLVSIDLIEKTNSQVETILTINNKVFGPVIFVDCDILPISITNFELEYPTVFTFKNKEKLSNYSNYKINKYGTVLDSNEKEKLYSQAGSGIYYFPDFNDFCLKSADCKSISHIIKKMLSIGTKIKVNKNSLIYRFGTLQDIYVDNFSFRKVKTKILNTGFTNNQVIKTGKKVLKTGDTIHNELLWYNAYVDKNKIPKVFGIDNQTLSIQFIVRDCDLNLDDIINLVNDYKTYNKLNNLSFDSYTSNIQNHLNKNEKITNGDILMKLLKSISLDSTFSHGDLSVMNIIPTKMGLKLIDPLYCKTKFGSYELDLAKLCFSLKFYKNDVASFLYIKNLIDKPYMDILIAAECVRVATYKQEYSFIAENLIKELN